MDPVHAGADHGGVMRVLRDPVWGCTRSSWSGVLTLAVWVALLAAGVGAERVSLVASAVAAGVCTVLLVHRARVSEAEREVWWRWARCAPGIALSVVLA